MNDKIITGTIENMDTGEKTEMAHYAVFRNYIMSAIVLIRNIRSYGENPDDGMEVYLTCKALDSIGMVYDLDVSFIPESSCEKTTILQNMTINSVHIVSGRYGFLNNEQLKMFDPEYCSVEPDYDEDDIREAFRINEKHRQYQ